jgi:hypothetical protein
MATLTNQQLITSLYVAAFGRAPDKSGLAYWNAQMDLGVKFDDVIASFLSSSEAASLVGDGVSDQSFLSNLYGNLLSRTADVSGGQYWQGRLDNLDSREALVKEFISSISDSTGDDAKLLENKIEIGQKFAASASGDNTIYAKAMLTYVTSETNTLTAAQALNDAFDNGVVAQPAPPTPTVPANYGTEFQVSFGYVGNFFINSTVTAADGIELPSFPGMSIDIGSNSIKITTTGPVDHFVDGVTLMISDVNDALPAFTGVNVISNTWTVDPAVAFDPAQIVASGDAVTLTLTGLNLAAGSTLEFALQS